MNTRELVEEELVYGALRREQLWRMIGIAVIEAQIYRYIYERETYNQLDNDLRVRRVLAQSSGAAETNMRAIWTSGQENYPPTRYGTSADMAVEIASITATLMFAFQPERTRSIDDVWQNPFGFTVTQYAIRSDRSE